LLHYYCIAALNTYCVHLASSREKDADALPARLGQAYVAALQYNDALRCFHAACNANPANAAAKDGLRRINMILRGLDPDFDDEHTNDDADEQEDEEEEVCVQRLFNVFSTSFLVSTFSSVKGLCVNGFCVYFVLRSDHSTASPFVRFEPICGTTCSTGRCATRSGFVPMEFPSR
jgi:hypothetical protein